MKKYVVVLALLVWCTASLAVAAAPVSGVAAVATGTDSVTVSWLPCADASRYSVHQATTASGPFHQVAAVGAATTHTQTGLSSATTYYFKVLAEPVTDSASANEATVVSATTSFGDSIALTEQATLHAEGIADAQMTSAYNIRSMQSGNIATRMGRIRSHSRRHQRNNDYNLNLSFSNPHAESERQAASREAARSEAAYASFNLGDLGVGSSWSGRGGQEIPVTVLKRWSFWSEGSVAFGYDDSKRLDLDYAGVGVMTGVDYAFSWPLVAGMAVGYARDKTDVGDEGSDNKTDAYTAAMYAVFSPAGNFYIEGVLGATYLDMAMRRYGGSWPSRGDRTGHQYFGNLAFGYDFRMKQLTFSPYAKAEAARTRLGRYVESGVPAIRYRDYNANLFALSGGFKTEYALPTSWGTLAPNVSFEYTHRANDKGSYAYGLAGSGDMVHISGHRVAAGKHTVNAGAGLDARIRSNIELGVRYLGSFAPSARTHQFSFQFGLAW